jgi:molybdopterin-guanine dinucleotide biosynthesis protein B
MKTVAIIGFKKSGKTTLLTALSSRLKQQGYRVGIVKHCHGPLDITEKDRLFFSDAVRVAVVSDNQTSVITRRSEKLADILAGFDADYVLVEGFKQEKTLPRIVCYSTPKEKKELSCGLEIGFVKNGALRDTTVKKLAGEIIRKGFKLPGADCGRCGSKTCFNLAKGIVAGKQKPGACVYAHSKSRLWINGKPIALNLFVDGLLQNVIGGFVRSLKGAEKIKKIVVEIPGEKT